MGVRVFVHNQSTTPAALDGFDVAVDTETNIAVNREFSQRLPAPYSNCVENINSFGSVFTDFYAFNDMMYTQSDCFNDCYTREVTKICGCVDATFSKMGFNSTPCITLQQFLCRGDVMVKFFKENGKSICDQECILLSFLSLA
jgi:hypothetical protein